MGRTSLLMVIIFNVIFMLMGFNLSQHVSDAYNKYIAYYNIEQAQYVSQSATNIGLNGMYITNLQKAGAVWIPSSGSITFPATFANGGGQFSLTLDSTAVFKTSDTMRLTVASSYGSINGYTISSKTIVDFARSSFTQYAMYTVTENGIYWITGDTCKGALHCQDTLCVSGNPYFKGAVTVGWGVYKLNGSSDHPTFNGGLHTGVNQPMPASWY